MRTKIAAALSVALATVLTGCAVDTAISEKDKTRALITGGDARPGPRMPAPQSFITVTTAEDRVMRRPVNVAVRDTALFTVLRSLMPETPVMALDADIDLTRPVTLFGNGIPLGDALKALGRNTDYDFQYNRNVLEVRSRVSREWTIATLASGRETSSQIGGRRGTTGSTSSTTSTSTSSSSGSSSSTSGGSISERGSQTTITQNENDWEGIVATAQGILGIERQADASARAADGSQIYTVRSQGFIRASSSPRKIAELDGFLSSLNDRSTKQVHIDMHVIEVSLDDSRGSGVNWQALINGSFAHGEGTISGTIGNVQPTDLVLPGLFSAGATITHGDDSVTTLLSFLQQYGEVKVVNQPNITVTNGRTANFSSGDEFSFLAGFDQTISNNGNSTISPRLERILVGLTFAVTPRLLDDGRILLEVVPVISSLKRFDTFAVPGSATPISTPNITLNELATQVITTPGRPVRLGGLQYDKLRESLNRIPRDKENSFLWGALDWLFKADSNTLSRRELVYTINPTLVGS